MPTATEMRDAYLAAERALLGGKQFRWGERWLTREDLVEIRKGRQEWEARVIAGEAAARGQSPRIARADFSRYEGVEGFRR